MASLCILRSSVPEFPESQSFRGLLISKLLLLFWPSVPQLRTRMVAQNRATTSLFLCCKELVQQEGPLALYKGISPALLGMVPSGAVFYTTYQILRTRFLRSPRGLEHLKTLEETQVVASLAPSDVGSGSRSSSSSRSKPKPMELGALRTLLYGGISGVCAETAIYPFEVVRRQLQLQSRSQQRSVIAVVRKLIETGGVAAFYSGYVLSALQVSIAAMLKGREGK